MNDRGDASEASRAAPELRAVTVPAPASSDAESSGRRSSASVRMNVEEAISTICPHCGEAGEDAGLLLNMSFLPVEEGLQVLVIRTGASMQAVTDQVRRTLIVRALRRTRGNHAKAARLLDMKYTTFNALAKRLLSAELLRQLDESRSDHR